MIARFGFVSGIGWAIDFAVFLTLIHAFGVATALANFIGASIAVTFVFFASVRHVFRYDGGYLWGKLAAYWCYQLVAVWLASLGIGALATALPPIWAKVLITPITFYANFQFMSLITTGRFRLT